MVEGIFAPVWVQIADWERNEEIHSDRILKLKQWIPATMGPLLTHLARVRVGDEQAGLEELERQLADRMFLLIEDVFRMGVTHECRGYDASVVRSPWHRYWSSPN